MHVSQDGSRNAASDNTDELLAFDAWNVGACEHESGVMLHHYLGNIALVALFRDLLGAHADRLPVVTTKVVYNGIHCGDRLSMADVRLLADEIELITQIHANDPREEQFLRDFEQQLRELTDCSLKIGKPIVF